MVGKNEGGNAILQEALLHGSASNGIESNKSGGGETVTPYSSASFFCVLTFSWMGNLIAAGSKKTLDLEDVPQLASIDSVRSAFPILRNKVESDCESSSKVTTFVLVKALIFTVWKEILLSAFLVLAYTLATYVGPYLIDTFVQYLNGRRGVKNEGYLLVSTFFIAKVVECLAQRHWFFKSQQAGFRARAALVAMIYNKGLTLSCQSKQSHTSGEIINFMTVDAERIGDFGWYMHDPWMVLLQVALALAILYKNLGLASIATFVATVLVMSANFPLGKLQEKFQEELMASKDRRMKSTSEILRNMRILKLQGWEMKFLSKIVELRNTEAGWLRRYVYTTAMTSFVFWVAPTFVSVVTFGACMLMGIPLESGKILSALATFRILQEPIYNLPDTISMIAQTKVSLDRIASFLRLHDLQPDVIQVLPRGTSDRAIEIVDGNFAWDVSSPTSTLKDINLMVSRGMRVAVCGTVGSGKSSLISSILGEMPKISGAIMLSGTKAYVAQSPWIQSGTIEENILFGKEMDREQYEKVLEACSLKKDLEILSFGDQTVIGERGINLSGGQKQRIQIARALYQDADIYLFDDPFSAVDAHTGSHLFKIVDGNFAWDVSSPTSTLKDINLRVSRGMRVAVCGTVGSGKSSLISSILGEMPKISGAIMLSGTKAYVAQSPWIQSGKIEENILFGKEMDREQYEKVLEACSLKKDLEILSFGDQTVIGERGINLSGGQKQRIQIARALYQDADIYLFDDPFSAVDAHTGSHLFKECLLGLLGTKTVVYVTHQVEFLPAADLILVMKNGRISQAGKYEDILNSGSDFMELVGAHKEALLVLDSVETRSGSGKSNISEEVDGIGEAKKVLKDEKTAVGQNGKADDVGGPKGQLVQEEEREKGKVGFSVYWKYITTAYGGALVPFILLAQVLFQLLQIGSNYWMAWATPVSSNVPAPVGGSTLLVVYVALAIGSSFCILSRALLLVTAGYKIATILFNKMHFCLFRAPMSFFDATPSGRILNRASTDQSALDLIIPSQVSAFAFSIIQLLGIIAVMSQVAWQVFIIFIPVIAICIWLQQYYISSARELARLIGVCKAPVIQHFAETISGSTTIRSFDQESRFRDTNMKLIDGYSRPTFHSSGAMEWLCIRLDMLSLITFTSSLVFLISVPEGTIDSSVAGLAVTYGLNLNMLQAWVIWNLCSMENKIISVERILQYTSLPSEPPLVIESNRPEADGHWPSHGEVDIRDLKVRYAPHMPLVLRGLTCTFSGGKKTGIVGRTGSGKSTLIQTLFRIVEPDGGHIFIDDINISLIGLHDLRSRLSIIPQDPTMFEGTIRGNLDPLEEHTDEQIWEALDKCQLGDEVRKKEGKLDSAVNENGENWSVGQRQLVCLGRVLLKKSKVLVLDEATASVDTATDNLIQQTLRQHFSDSTVITIAHRITSVLDSDMVLLLDLGLIEEYDTPTKLLENKSSSFARLVAEYSVRSK
ncbi:unnamed protein product [Ilex paraguariensis]|uniref:ABC-type xenobiotic transporter n=1 Tax=Ilex paraguariensis TaxID=185542 RepID=A0ABC8TBV3_9AQUA